MKLKKLNVDVTEVEETELHEKKKEETVDDGSETEGYSDCKNDSNKSNETEETVPEKEEIKQIVDEENKPNKSEETVMEKEEIK